MKKVIWLFIIILTYGNILLSNPLLVPRAIISELIFEDSSKWLLEINLLYSSQNHKFNYDSICVKTSSGFSRIRLDNISESTNLFVVTSDSLTSPLSINRQGDFIKLYPFLSIDDNYIQIDSLYFGNYPGSIIDSLPMEYSIVRISNNLFAKDQSPSIGQPNDTVGTYGVLTGHIYDKNNKPLTDGDFYLDNTFSIHNDGTYLTNIYSRKVIYNQILFRRSPYPYIDIDTIELNINPGVLFEKDIHILEDFSGVEENTNKPDYEIRVINYPNPFNTSTNFAITIPFSQKYRQKQINIYNTLGQKINSITISNQSSVQWDGKDNNGNTAATGIYYYQLVLDNRTYKNGSMILLK